MLFKHNKSLKTNRVKCSSAKKILDMHENGEKCIYIKNLLSKLHRKTTFIGITRYLVLCMHVKIKVYLYFAHMQKFTGI